MTHAAILPPIIQGGMGVAVSDWRLARAVASRGQLGVVSGTAIDTVIVRRLQDGDLRGDVRRAMAAFPIPDVAKAVLERYFIPGGRAPGTPYKMLPMHRLKVSTARSQLTALAGFVEVFLAKEGHSGVVGMNLLTKVQLPNLATLYGALLAGVDAILMGAGIPREIPGALDHLARHEPASLRLDLEGAPADVERRLELDPKELWPGEHAPLARPPFLAIIASNSLATMLSRKATGTVNGFIIEAPTAGGHNAPPRGAPTFNDKGEPIYGERDVVDLDKMRELGVPFWLAGGTGRAGALAAAQAAGAVGIQVGTLFAYCEESGLETDLKHDALDHAISGKATIVTDPRASPTGYPFKVVEWEGGPGRDAPRERVCDLGYLRESYHTPDGKVGYRCAAEPVDQYVAKGGKIEDTVGRKCLCNALTADIGQPQVRDGGTEEPPLLTSGDDLDMIRAFLGDRTRYHANDVLEYLLG